MYYSMLYERSLQEHTNVFSTQNLQNNLMTPRKWIFPLENLRFVVLKLKGNIKFLLSEFYSKKHLY